MRFMWMIANAGLLFNIWSDPGWQFAIIVRDATSPSIRKGCNRGQLKSSQGKQVNTSARLAFLWLECKRNIDSWSDRRYTPKVNQGSLSDIWRLHSKRAAHQYESNSLGRTVSEKHSLAAVATAITSNKWHPSHFYSSDMCCCRLRSCTRGNLHDLRLNSPQSWCLRLHFQRFGQHTWRFLSCRTTTFWTCCSPDPPTSASYSLDFHWPCRLPLTCWKCHMSQKFLCDCGDDGHRCIEQQGYSNHYLGLQKAICPW